MSLRQPVLFVSHGAPDLLLHPGATGALWAEFGRTLPRPRAILVVSAHWLAPAASVSATSRPDTIHDFSGFPAPLYALRYPAPGAPELATRVQALLEVAGLPVRVSASRGLDHGAWAPLSLMYPDADIPVTQLSLVAHADAAAHRRLGAALRPLRDEGVLILASGAVTHNFGWLAAHDAPPHPAAAAFADWVAAALSTAPAALDDYRTQAPHGAAAHPSDEHLLPLAVAAGAADADDTPQRFTPGFTYGGLAMDAWLWHPEPLSSQPLQGAPA